MPPLSILNKKKTPLTSFPEPCLLLPGMGLRCSEVPPASQWSCRRPPQENSGFHHGNLISPSWSLKKINKQKKGKITRISGENTHTQPNFDSCKSAFIFQGHQQHAQKSEVQSQQRLCESWQAHQATWQPRSPNSSLGCLEWAKIPPVRSFHDLEPKLPRLETGCLLHRFKICSFWRNFKVLIISMFIKEISSGSLRLDTPLKLSPLSPTDLFYSPGASCDKSFEGTNVIEHEFLNCFQEILGFTTQQTETWNMVCQCLSFAKPHS